MKITVEIIKMEKQRNNREKLVNLKADALRPEKILK